MPLTHKPFLFLKDHSVFFSFDNACAKQTVDQSTQDFSPF